MRSRPAPPTSPRAALFDVDGVLVHGYHARRERQTRWDEDRLAALGVGPGRFRHDFIYDVLIAGRLAQRKSAFVGRRRNISVDKIDRSTLTAYYLSAPRD